MTRTAVSSAPAPPTASRRPAAACSGGSVAAAAAPALAAAPAANRKGRPNRASCQTGTDVFATSAPVYVEMGRPSAAATRRAARAPGTRPVWASRVARDVAAPVTVSSHDPTLIGDVTL